MNNLSRLGFNTYFEEYINQTQISSSSVGRIIRQDRSKYLIKTGEQEAFGEPTGNMLHGEGSLPVVGDWVQIMDFDDQYIITSVLPPYSQLSRKASGSSEKTQAMATNIDVAFIVQSLDHDFNLNRLERYLAMTLEGGIPPMVILNKSDLVSQSMLLDIEAQVRQRINEDIKVISMTTTLDADINKVRSVLKPGMTYCFLGSSGVGKSSIVNRLLGEQRQETSHISTTTGKGRHTTTSRQLMFTSEGAIIIDTPGMRELGITATEYGINASFDRIAELSHSCKFSDCTHQDEPGCAVLQALETRELDEQQLVNYHKLMQESQRYQKTKAEMNKEGKRFGRMYKEAQAHRKRYKA